jgi:hypothetical protein
MARSHCIKPCERESEALAEYQRVLTIFSELILHGTVPDGDPDS